MTPAQENRLYWFARHGGRGRLDHSSLIMEDKTVVNWPGLLAVMHLVAMGAIAGDQGYLSLTDYGRRLLEGADASELPL